MVRGLPGCDLAWTEPYECLETLTAADEPLETGRMNSDHDRLEMDGTESRILHSTELLYLSETLLLCCRA